MKIRQEYLDDELGVFVSELSLNYNWMFRLGWPDSINNCYLLRISRTQIEFIYPHPLLPVLVTQCVHFFVPKATEILRNIFIKIIWLRRCKVGIYNVDSTCCPDSRGDLMINAKTAAECFSGQHCHDLGSESRAGRDNRLETRVERGRENINIVLD